MSCRPSRSSSLLVSSEDLLLHGDPDVHGCRVAVLVHPRELDIHRVDLFDRAGRPLPDVR